MIMYREVIYKYTLKNVNLREGKSQRARVLTVIPKGSKIELLDAEEDWLKVKYGSLEGYVYNENISTSMYPWVDVNLRETDSRISKSLGMIKPGERVEVIGSKGLWKEVIYNDKEGYVFGYYISEDGKRPTEYNYLDFNSDMTEFVNYNNLTSTTGYLLVTNIEQRLTYVFKKNNNTGMWEQLYKWICTVGKPSTLTIKGTFYISGRKPYFGTDEYRVKYATRITGAYYYHSILYNPAGTQIKDGRLGLALSHGCIRLATENARWIYNNIPDGTTVFIH